MTKKPEPLFWLNDARGRFLPRDFATTFAGDRSAVENVSDEDWAILEAGPDHEQYWDAWQEVEQKALITLDDGVYRIHNDSDCWLIPVGMEWDDETDWFGWPRRRKGARR